MLVAVFYRVPMSAGTLFVVPGLLLVMTASLLPDHDFRASQHAVPRRRAYGDGCYAGRVLRDAGHFPGRSPAQPAQPVVRDQLNPMYHLIEVVRRPLLTATPPDWHSYAAVGIVLVVLCAGAAGVIAAFQRRIVFAL